MSETQTIPTEDNTHEELDAWAAERGIDLPDGTKAEKIEAIEAALADDADATPDEDPLPEPVTEDPAPEPGITPEEEEQIPGTVESHDTEEDGVLRRADGTVRPKVVKKAPSDKQGFNTGLHRTSEQFAKRARG